MYIFVDRKIFYQVGEQDAQLFQYIRYINHRLFHLRVLHVVL